MEHFSHIEWNNVQPEREKYFLRAEDLANCVTERILRNTFHDPLISSSDDEEPNVINWDEVFNQKQNHEKNHRLFVPGCRGTPKYPKLSSLTSQQHTQLLKVLCANNPHILPQKEFPRPTKVDFKLFEELRPQYEKEQKEYIAWAKTLWATEHCVRALRPKPAVEMVYEAQFKMRANELQCYPKTYVLAAQIPLEGKYNDCEMIYCEDLISVDNLDLPQIKCETIEEKINIVKACSVPEPCNKHPCKFVLPMEKSVSILPLTEIERELAQYALEHGAQYIAGESALKCLLTLDQPWNITVCVCEVIDSNGEKSNVGVLGGEFAVAKESVLRRTYKAFRHLLEDALVPISEKARLLRERSRQEVAHSSNCSAAGPEPSSDDEGSLCIDTGDDLEINENTSETRNEIKETEESNEAPPAAPAAPAASDAPAVTAAPAAPAATAATAAPAASDAPAGDARVGKVGFYECTCKDTMFEMPPPRSYKKWRTRSQASGDEHDIIVHCAHKVRNATGEVVLEPIPEYQLECGAVSLSRDQLAALALSLYLRRNATLLNVRVDGASNEVVTMEKWSLAELGHKYGDMLPRVAGALHSALGQLRGLLPGRYVLQHDPSHGANALLYRPGGGAGGGGASGAGGGVLQLAPGEGAAPPADPSAGLRAAPTLCADLLPMHKFRRILPCAFTPYKDQLPKQLRRPSAKGKAPPQAIKSSPARGRKRGRGRGGARGGRSK